MSKYLIISLVFLLAACSSQRDSKTYTENWIALFDGETLEGWTPKFAGYDVGVNYKETFRVTDGLLQANYAAYDSFRNEFGHLFYKDKFSHYRLKVEYRSVGVQPTGGEEWAYRNNGLMLHSQHPSTMLKQQGFPLSIEFQLLGGTGEGTRPNGNLCTPGCNVELDGSVYVPHCITNYEGPTYHGDQWIRAEAVVLGDSMIHHIINGDTVLSYSKPEVGGELFGIDTIQFPVGSPMKDGYIAIQAESHGFDFKSIELLDLCGCTDEKAANYKPYYFKSDLTRCIYN